MQSEELPSFETVAQGLKDADAAIGASEVHGLVCGFICSGVPQDQENWLNNMSEILDVKLTQESVQNTLLSKLYKTACLQLADINFSFQMLLPADDSALNERAQSLTTWCQGFLCGLGLAGIELGDDLPKDLREGLIHMSEIAKLEVDDLSVNEEDEIAYVEVSEYVRMVVFAMYGEFGMRDPGRSKVH